MCDQEVIEPEPWRLDLTYTWIESSYHSSKRGFIVRFRYRYMMLVKGRDAHITGLDLRASSKM